MALTQTELMAGSSVTMNLDMVNVGKTAALLDKVENIVPEGLEIWDGNTSTRADSRSVALKGIRLDYMKTHVVKIMLKAKYKGDFELKPRVSYFDEKGKVGSYDFERMGLTVKELGISGWLKGPK